MIMRIIAYVVSVIGMLVAFTAQDRETVYLGAAVFGVGVLVWIICRILDKIDPDGAGEL